MDDEDGPAPTTLDNNENFNDNSNDNSNEHANVPVRPAEDLVYEAIDKVDKLNRTQRRNLIKLLKPAVKGR